MKKQLLDDAVAILEKLVGFRTVSRDGNRDLIGFVESYLRGHGVETRLVPNEDGSKANLYAAIGPTDRPGIMLSGHTDVVPVDGQSWIHPPFLMKTEAGRAYGRGTADMKGFIACVLASVPEMVSRRLAQPLHIALSYDEEIGCVGVRRLLPMIEALPIRPAGCIVGEPTSMQVVLAHKGKTAARVICTGHEAHSSLTPDGLNAIHLACDMIETIRSVQAQVEQSGDHDADYAVPFTTLHVGTINGGTVLNIVPRRCTFDFEIRNLPEDDPATLAAPIYRRAVELTETARERFPDAGVEIETINTYPGLDTSPEDELVAFVKALTGGNSHGKISFGTEGGLFSSHLGIPTVVCGPGNIEQAHKPDEFIELEQLDRCTQFLSALTEHVTLRPD